MGGCLAGDAMSLWSFLRDVTSFGAHPQPEVRATLGGGILTPSYQQNKATWPDRTIDTYDREGYRKLALVFRLVGIVAHAAGSAPVRVYREEQDGELTELPKHPLRQLMVRPNPQMRESRFIATVSMIASIAGFCLIEKERGLGGRVIGLWTLRSDWAKPIPRANRLPDWEYRIPGRDPITLKSEDVLHVTYADRPDGSPFGLGPLEVALREVGIANVMTDFLKAFFDTGAMPVTGLVMREGWPGDQSDADLIKETWRRRYGGLMNSVEPALLKDIVDVKRLSFDFNELAYLDLRDISDLALCQAFGVPPILAGVRYGLERSTFANYGEARRSFYEDTVSPLWARLDDVLTLGLLPEFDTSPGTALQFDTSAIPALQEDRNTRAGWLTTAYLGGGISSHVYHGELGLPLPPQDFYLRGMVQDAIPATDPLGIGRAPRVTVSPVPPALSATTDDEEPTADDEARSLVVVREHRAGLHPTEFRASVAVLNRRAVQRIAATVVGWLRDFFGLQSDRIIATSGRVVDWQAEERALTDVIARAYHLAGDTAYRQIGEQYGAVGIAFDLAHPNLTDVRHLLAERVTGINDESQRVIQNVVTDALGRGVSMPELAAELQGQFQTWSDGRAMTIARTESQVAFNSASLAGYRQSGVVDRVQLFDNPAHTDDYGASDGLSCAERNGLIVPLAEASRHIEAEHPNGTLAVSGVLVGEDA
jgi:HK97 family phage portal protein